MNHSAPLLQVFPPAAGGVEQKQAVEQQHPVEQRVLPDHQALEGVHGTAAEEGKAQPHSDQPRAPPPHPDQAVGQHGGHGAHLQKAEQVSAQLDQAQLVKGPEDQPQQQGIKDGVSVVQPAVEGLLQQLDGVHVQPHRAPAQKDRQPKHQNNPGVQRQLPPQRPGRCGGCIHSRQMGQKVAQPQQNGKQKGAEQHPECQKGKVKLHGTRHHVLP